MKENGDDMEKLFQSVKNIIEKLPEQNRVLLQMLCVHLGIIFCNFKFGSYLSLSS